MILTKALATLMLTASFAAAQPSGDRPPPPDESRRTPRASEDTPPSPEALRARLTQTLDFAKRIVEKHEAALAQLDAGDDPREVLRSLRTPEDRRAVRSARRQNPNTSGVDDSNPSMHPGEPAMLSPGEMRQVRAFIADHLPEVNAQLELVEAHNPQTAEQLASQLAPKVLDIIRLSSSDSAMSSLRLDELKAGLWYVDAASKYRGLLRTGSQDKAAVEKAKQEVQAAASARFDAQVHIKQYEIHQLTMRIEQLHEALEELNAQRDEQVQSQVISATRTPGPRFNRQSTGRANEENKPKSDPEDDE